MSLTNCRFYEEKYPEVDSFVMVNVKQVRDIQIFWHLNMAYVRVSRSLKWVPM